MTTVAVRAGITCTAFEPKLQKYHRFCSRHSTHAPKTCAPFIRDLEDLRRQSKIGDFSFFIRLPHYSAV